MNKRHFLAATALAAALPTSTRAQQPALPLIGFLSGAPSAPFAHLLADFRQGPGDTGYVEGKNVATEYRWAENRCECLPEMANDLVPRQVAVLVVICLSLQGARSSNIPVEQPTKFEQVVNLKAAKVLGITVPRSILLRADRVVE